MMKRHDQERWQASRQAFLGRGSDGPEAEWYASVMREVHRAGRPDQRSSPLLVVETMTWRTGWILAAAASVFALISLVAMPTRERLAWDLYKDGTVTHWSMTVQE